MDADAKKTVLRMIPYGSYVLQRGTLYLVSCVSKKRCTPAPAREFYTSDWFLKARDYVERDGSPWFILSAKYGLVSPSQILRPVQFNA
jgi:hypothetical protein